MGAGACWYGSAQTGIRLHGTENGSHRDYIIWGCIGSIGVMYGYIGVILEQ